MVNFEWYRSFVAVYQAGTVTAAAERRFLTQPTLSQHVAALEHALGTRLFERAARRMIPTASARLLYPQIIAAVERLDAIGRRSLAHDETHWVRVGAPVTYFHDVSLDRLTPLRKRKVFVNARFSDTDRLIEDLVKGDLDLVVATQKLPLPRVHYTPLETERFVVVGAPGVVVPKRARSSLRDVERWLASRQWIAFGAELPIIRRYWQQVFHKRPEFRPTMVVPDLHAIVRAVAAGYGLSVVPSYLLTRNPTRADVSVVWASDEEVTNQLYVACRIDRVKDPLIEAVARALAPKAP